MNSDLLNIIKQIVAERGDTVLSEPKIVSAFFSDLARDVPKPQRNALIKCLEHKFVQALKNVGKAERANCKQKLAEKLHNEEGLDIVLCGNAVELLATVLFGEENTFNTFTDPRDGRVYKTVKIGTQVWMAENLAYNAPRSICYENNEENGKKYGRLYDWNTAMKACPSGWHLPSNDEWQTLVNFAGGEKIAGKKLKAKSGWKSGYDNKDCNGTDEYGFAAMPGGIGGGGSNGFSSINDFGYWWTNSASENDDSHVYGEYINFNSDDVYHYDYDKSYLFSVRCIKD